jgi:hypothetical protein
MKILVACEESQAVTIELRKLGHEAYSCDIEPCTYLTVAGNRYFNVERYGNKAIERMRKQEQARDFFMKFVNADCEKIAIENPVGRMNTFYRKPDQIINPFNFGPPVSKKTCLWLKGLQILKHTKEVEPEIIHSKGESGGYSGVVGM